MHFFHLFFHTLMTHNRTIFFQSRILHLCIYMQIISTIHFVKGDVNNTPQITPIFYILVYFSILVCVYI